MENSLANDVITLGEAKVCSRLAATISWNAGKDRFEMKCHGKNGMIINKQFYGKDTMAGLFSGCPIKIGHLCAYFMLPSPLKVETTEVVSDSNEAISNVSDGKVYEEPIDYTDWIHEAFKVKGEPLSVSQIISFIKERLPQYATDKKYNIPLQRNIRSILERRCTKEAPAESTEDSQTLQRAPHILWRPGETLEDARVKKRARVNMREKLDGMDGTEEP